MDKSVISVRVEPETMEKLKALCNVEKRSQSKMIEIIIDAYSSGSDNQSLPLAKPMAIVKPTPQLKKAAGNKFSLADELAKLKQ